MERKRTVVLVSIDKLDRRSCFFLTRLILLTVSIRALLHSSFPLLMSHAHHHHPKPDFSKTDRNRAFAISVLLNTGFVVVQATYGFLTNSLALLADAGHNLSDVLGLLLAWGASLLVRRLPTPRRTYGLRRASILAALLNAILILLASGSIAWEAIQRFANPQEIPATTVIVVAAIGIGINAGSALLFWRDRQSDLNLRGAFLHLVADAVVSLGVVLAGVAIAITGWNWFDPAISLIIVVAIAYSSWQLLKESLNLTLDAVPMEIEPLAARTYLSDLRAVEQVHDLHIWAMSTTDIALTVHLVMPDGHPGDGFLARVRQELEAKFGINHTTIQIETGDRDYPCPLASDLHL